MTEKANPTTKSPETKKDWRSRNVQNDSSPSKSVATPLDQIMYFQRTIGNQAVQRLLQGSEIRSQESGGRGRGLFKRIQAKLKIGQSNDKYEQEADRVADQVMRMEEGKEQRAESKTQSALRLSPCVAVQTKLQSSLVQRQTEEEELEEDVQAKPMIQRQAIEQEEQELHEQQGEVNEEELIQPKLRTNSEHLIQRQPTDVGFTPTPAPTQTEPTTEPTPEEATAPELIVEDSVEDLQSGQMKKSEFLAIVREEVSKTVEPVIATTDRTTGDFPYLVLFRFLAGRNTRYINRTLRKFVPATSNLTNAREYIPIIKERARQSAEVWVRTGEITGLPSGVPTDMVKTNLTGAIGSIFFKGQEGGPIEAGDPQAIQAQLGSGHSLEGSTKSRMESAFRQNFSQVRVHTSPGASNLSNKLNARAFTVGKDIAFGSGEYQPGTPVGDAIIAHELAHTVQQGRGNNTGTKIKKGETSYNALEEEADISAVGAVVSMWSGVNKGFGNISRNALPRLRSGLKLQRCSGGTSPEYEISPHRQGPHIGARVAVLAPGGNMVTQEFIHRAVATIGEAGTENEAITMAKVANDPAAIIAANGVFFVYRISLREDIFGSPMSYNPILIANAGLRVEYGVIAIVANANVYRTGFHRGRTSTDETRNPYQETFEPYLELHEGGLSEASEAEFLAIFEAAMRDNALSVLAESQRQAEQKRGQFSQGPGAVSPGEKKTIEDTAREALQVQSQIEELESRQRSINHEFAQRRTAPTQEQLNRLSAVRDQLEPLRIKRREVNLDYPMIGRYESVSDLEAFLGRDETGRIAALAEDTREVLQNIAITRTNILTGDLNLWLLRPIIDSTIAGLRVTEDSDQRRWVNAKAQAQGARDRNAQIALAVLSIGLGLAAAFATGGASLILTTGALGVGVYDAVRTTEEHFVREAGADTDIDRIDGTSLLPENMRQHWGWLVLAWVGVGLDAFDVARVIGQVGRTTRGVGLIDEAAQSLAAGDAKLLARLRRAAGNVDIAETIGESNRAAVSRAVGAEVEINPLAKRSVEVLYEIEEGTGRTVVRGVRAGSEASVGDIVAHADTVRMLRRRGTLSERLHDLWTRVRTFGREGSVNPFEDGCAAFESWQELRKLDDMRAVRRAQLREALKAGEDARPAQEELRRQLAFLENEFDRHRRVVDTLADMRSGRGAIAMSDDTRAALEAGERLPDFPDRAVGELSNEDLLNSRYYFERSDDGSFVLRTKPDRPTAAGTPGHSSVENVRPDLDRAQAAELPTIADDLARGRIALGETVGEGGFGRVVELPGHPDLVAKIAQANEGTRNAQLAQEAVNLEMLAARGYQTPYLGVISWIDDTGVERHAIILRQTEGALSKQILQTGKFTDVVPDESMLRLVNDKTLADLRAFRARAAADDLYIEDLQFMIARDGSAHLIDPARVTRVGRGARARRIHRRYLRHIDNLIREFMKIRGGNR